VDKVAGFSGVETKLYSHRQRDSPLGYDPYIDIINRRKKAFDKLAN
jgi:hypothetical protein